MLVMSLEWGGFESYVGSIIGTMVLGAAMVAGSINFSDELSGLSPILLPLVLGGIGIITSIIGTFLVKVREGGDPKKALNTGEFVSAILMVVASYFAINKILPQSWTYGNINSPPLESFWAKP